MPDMTFEEQERIELLFETADENKDKLNSWERKFIQDNQERYIDDTGGEWSPESKYFVSPKMWALLSKIEIKLGIT